MTPAKFKVALVQMAVSTKRGDNLAKASARIEEAAAKGAQMVCLPELFQSQYFCQREDVALFRSGGSGARADYETRWKR